MQDIEKELELFRNDVLDEGILWNKDNIIGVFGMKVLKLGFGYVVNECRTSWIKFKNFMEFYQIKKDTILAINKMFKKGYKSLDPITNSIVTIHWDTDEIEEGFIDKSLKIFNITLKVLQAINDVYPITKLVYRLLTMSNAPKDFYQKNKKDAIGAVIWLLLVHHQFDDIAVRHGIKIHVQTKIDFAHDVSREYRKELERKKTKDKEEALKKFDTEEEDFLKKAEEEEAKEKEEEDKEEVLKKANEKDKKNVPVKKRTPIKSTTVRLMANKYMRR